MGGGSFSEETYTHTRALRSASGIPDFEYTQTATKIYDTLDPMRILSKPYKMLESRDSVEHPISTPLIMSFDVTGSNYNNAKVAQQKLPDLMAKLTAVCENPQVAIWANDDAYYVGRNAIQLGEFESDNRIDDTIRNIWLTGKGGGNTGESYELILYAAARKTITDSYEKRHKKGYLCMYADEPFFDKVAATHIQEIFGDNAQADIPIADIVAEVQQKWLVYLIWPQNGQHRARNQYVELFGESNVITLQAPEHLCDQVASIVAANEQTLMAVGVAATANMDEEFTARVE